MEDRPVARLLGPQARKILEASIERRSDLFLDKLVFNRMAHHQQRLGIGIEAQIMLMLRNLLKQSQVLRLYLPTALLHLLNQRVEILIDFRALALRRARQIDLLTGGHFRWNPKRQARSSVACPYASLPMTDLSLKRGHRPKRGREGIHLCQQFGAFQ